MQRTGETKPEGITEGRQPLSESRGVVMGGVGRGPGSQPAMQHRDQRPVLPQGDPGKCPEAASQGGFSLHFVHVVVS